MDERYEYLVKEPPTWVGTSGEMSDWLNRQSAKGWRLIKIPDEGTWYYFERVVEWRLGVSDEREHGSVQERDGSGDVDPQTQPTQLD